MQELYKMYFRPSVVRDFDKVKRGGLTIDFYERIRVRLNSIYGSEADLDQIDFARIVRRLKENPENESRGSVSMRKKRGKSPQR